MGCRGRAEGGRKELIAELYKDGWVYLKHSGDYIYFVHLMKKGKATASGKIIKNI